MAKESERLHLLIHAPTPGALARARRNAANVLRAQPEAVVRIVINAGAVDAALAEPDPTTDRLLIFCGNTLSRLGREAPAGAPVVEVAAFAIGEMQREGWIYLRA